MNEQKYCIKHKLGNGTYLAILNNGWRYDGSVIVEADNEKDLEAKINAATKNDDVWRYIHGHPVLIKGGAVKRGAARFRGMGVKNGKLKGNKVVSTSAPVKGERC